MQSYAFQFFEGESRFVYRFQTDGTPAVKRQPWRITEEGLLIGKAAVLAVDVLGMRRLLKRMSLEEIYRRVVMTFVESEKTGVTRVPLADDMASLGFEMTPGCLTLAVSDSLLVVLPEDPTEEGRIAPAEAVLELSKKLARCLVVCSEQDVRIRGAVAFGELLLAADRRAVILGDPVREAFAWEHRQQWIGGMLAPSATDAVRDVADINACPYLVEYDIPLKESLEPVPSPLVAVDWRRPEIAGWHAPRVPQRDESTSGDYDIELKVSNTRKFFGLDAL